MSELEQQSPSLAQLLQVQIPESEHKYDYVYVDVQAKHIQTGVIFKVSGCYDRTTDDVPVGMISMEDNRKFDTEEAEEKARDAFDPITRDIFDGTVKDLLGKTITLQYLPERTKVELKPGFPGGSYFDLAKEIADKAREAPLDEHWLAYRIKQYVHAEKFSVYHRMSMYSKQDPHLKEFCDQKVETHKKLARVDPESYERKETKEAPVVTELKKEAKSFIGVLAMDFVKKKLGF